MIQHKKKYDFSIRIGRIDNTAVKYSLKVENLLSFQGDKHLDHVV